MNLALKSKLKTYCFSSNVITTYLPVSTNVMNRWRQQAEVLQAMKSGDYCSTELLKDKLPLGKDRIQERPAYKRNF